MSCRKAFLIPVYRAYLDRKRILRLCLSQTFEKDIYNYNIIALYYTDDSIIPFGEWAGHTEGQFVKQEDSNINTYELYSKYLEYRERK